MFYKLINTFKKHKEFEYIFFKKNLIQHRFAGKDYLYTSKFHK